MLATRAVVGVGEAAYGPAAPAVLSDMYPVEVAAGPSSPIFTWRSRSGSAVGYTCWAAVMRGLTHDWRWAFFVVVPPGLLLALLCFFMREPQRGEADLSTKLTPPPGPIIHDPENALVSALHAGIHGDDVCRWRHRLLGAALCKRKPRRRKSLHRKLVSAASPSWPDSSRRWPAVGRAMRCAALSRLLFSRFLRRHVVGLSLVPGVLITPFPWAYGLIFLTVFCLFFNTGPVNAIIANVTNPAVRAQRIRPCYSYYSPFRRRLCSARHRLCRRLARQTAAANPQATWWTGLLASHGGMDFSFCVVSLAIALAAAFWYWGARYLERDTALAPTARDDGLIR